MTAGLPEKVWATENVRQALLAVIDDDALSTLLRVDKSKFQEVVSVLWGSVHLQGLQELVSLMCPIVSLPRT